jgi:hypothetical protein
MWHCAWLHPPIASTVAGNLRGLLRAAASVNRQQKRGQQWQ